MSQQYTNELPTDVLERLRQPRFTDEFLMQGESMALVGSMLDNGDEIISTPQGSQMFVFREGDALPDGFLTVPGGKH